MTSRLQSFSPWDQMQQFQHELNRLFDRWNGDRDWQRGFAGTYPALNVWEDAEHVFVEAELPGLSLNDLEIYVTGGNQLTIKGERRFETPQKGVWHRKERGQGTFTRALTLPFAVDADKVEARFENGVLFVRLPKHASAKPRKINVKGE
jgi:HSP20 family protein